MILIFESVHHASVVCVYCDTFFITAWKKHPTITEVYTMTYPIEKVTFPTITLCPENSNPDRWGPTIKVFDFFQRQCLSHR